MERYQKGSNEVRTANLYLDCLTVNEFGWTCYWAIPWILLGNAYVNCTEPDSGKGRMHDRDHRNRIHPNLSLSRSQGCSCGEILLLMGMAVESNSPLGA